MWFRYVKEICISWLCHKPNRLLKIPLMKYGTVSLIANLLAGYIIIWRIIELSNTIVSFNIKINNCFNITICMWRNLIIQLHQRECTLRSILFRNYLQKFFITCSVHIRILNPHESNRSINSILNLLTIFVVMINYKLLIQFTKEHLIS